MKIYTIENTQMVNRKNSRIMKIQMDKFNNLLQLSKVKGSPMIFFGFQTYRVMKQDSQNVTFNIKFFSQTNSLISIYLRVQEIKSYLLKMYFYKQNTLFSVHNSSLPRSYLWYSQLQVLCRRMYRNMIILLSQ